MGCLKFGLSASKPHALIIEYRVRIAISSPYRAVEITVRLVFSCCDSLASCYSITSWLNGDLLLQFHLYGHCTAKQKRY